MLPRRRREPPRGRHVEADHVPAVGVAKGGIAIGDDVWLGAGVIVLDGVTIGRGAVVGAGAVVAASLPEYATAVASRALKIGDRRDLGK